MTEAEERLAETLREIAALRLSTRRRWLTSAIAAIVSVAIVACIDIVWLQNGPTFMAGAVLCARLFGGWRAGWLAAILGFVFGELAISLPDGYDYDAALLITVVAPAAAPSPGQSITAGLWLAGEARSAAFWPPHRWISHLKRPRQARHKCER